MKRQAVYITGMGCLTPLALDVAELATALAGGRQAISSKALPAGCGRSGVLMGAVKDFSGQLAHFIPASQRRRMSRLSRLAAVAAGQALKAAGLPGADAVDTGVALGTAFGSTGQSETFFLDLLGQGPDMVNPGLFPETVPNAPAGQISIAYHLEGPNTTVCQQSLSSEMALLLALQMLESGMARRMLVLGVEEMSPALLKGLDAMALLKRPAEQAAAGIQFSSRFVPGEAAVALVLETETSARQRGAAPLAAVVDIETGGEAAWQARCHGVENSLTQVIEALRRRQQHLADMVVAGGTYAGKTDRLHWNTLSTLLAPDTLVTAPEYATGSLMGAGLFRVLVAALQLGGAGIPCTTLATPLPQPLRPDTFFTVSPPRPSRVMTSTVSPGGGAGAVILAGVE